MDVVASDIADTELGKYGIGPKAPSSTKDELKAGEPVGVWENMTNKAIGSHPSPERRRFMEGVGTLVDAAHMGSYLTPAGPYVAATDFAHGLASGNPTEAFLSASGLQGRAAKALGMATSTLMPDSAQAGPLSKALNAIRAYHGSPHKFDRFDISKIGTGEGAQAYGHGLYFAESEPVAWSYKHSTSGKQATHSFDDTPLDDPRSFYSIEDRLKSEGNWRQAKALREYMNANEPDIGLRIRQMKDWHRNDPEMVKAIDDLSGRVKTSVSPGHMYEVDIHANPEHMLDWDKPLSYQSPIVKKALSSAHEARGMPDISEFLSSETNPGMDAYESLGRTWGGKSYGSPKAAEALREAGIPGIRYLDQGSRGAGEGTSNYVVFDPSIIEILRRYKDGGAVEGRVEDAGEAPAAGPSPEWQDIMRRMYGSRKP
jgi:hypothetical protein